MFVFLPGILLAENADILHAGIWRAVHGNRKVAEIICTTDHVSRFGLGISAACRVMYSITPRDLLVVSRRDATSGVHSQ